jgi:hypothetical protein
MSAAKYNLTIEQGADLNLSMLLKNGDGSVMDLTNYTARMHIRRYVFEDEFLLELTTGNGRIVFSLVTGTLTLRLTSAETAALTECHGVYDLELVHSSGNVIRLIEGAVSISPEVTR